ncbi:zinc ribbon domain-containing protein [Marisediminicola senii]|uniref:zinc ribbon domain-containing protein n=1 Tax=Marisediminicola senii TaxID=2711233 RepID=UPI0013ED5762|nr:hypothetical protein [Marisediminicola senii]
MALKATPEAQARLLELQAIDTRIQQLDHRAKNLPEDKALATIAAEVERLRLQRRSETGDIDDVTTELSRIESDVAVVEARIARDVGRQQSSSSVKDVAGLESEIAGLRRRLDELENAELAVMEKLETLNAGARISAEEYDDLVARKADVERQRSESLAAVMEEREHAVANRQAIAAGLGDDLLALYERQRQRYGTGASLLRGGVSSASGVRLLENELAIVRSAAPDDVLICPDSQAILVRTSESGLDRPQGAKVE